MSRRTAVQTNRVTAYLAFLSFAAAAGCTAEPIEESGPDGGSPAESAAELGAGPLDFQPIDPCLSESDYVPRGVVRFGFSREPFTPPCLRLATGGTVVFQGLSPAHPLQPRDSDSASPIISSSGTIEFEFTDFGFFPYQCAAHPDEKGVVWASYAF